MTARRVVAYPAITREQWLRQERQPKKAPTRGTPASADPKERGRADWLEDAPCRGQTDVFYVDRAEPGDGFGDKTAAAKAICRRCPFTVECEALWQSLPYGQAQHGVWFGHAGKMRRVARETVCGRCGEVYERAPRSKSRFCQPCRYALRSEAIRASNLRRGSRAINRAPIPGVLHGSRDGYRNKGCRCPECCAWQADKRRKAIDREKAS